MLKRWEDVLFIFLQNDENITVIILKKYMFKFSDV